MKKTRTVLLKVAYFVELPEESLNTNDEILEKVTNRICENKSILIDNKEITLNWSCTSSLMLDSDSQNCGKCSKCGQWTTDKDRPDAIEGLSNGATVNGRLLCDECLPSDHRWAF